MDNKATVPEFQGMLESRGVSRRSFMKLCGTLAVMVGLGEAAAPRVAQALEESVIGASQGDLYPVIWIEGASCTGCTEAFAQIDAPDPASIVLEMISLNYSETLSAAAGWSMEEAKEQTIAAGNYILIYEGAVLNGWDGNALRIAGKTGNEHLIEAAEKANAVVALGSCAVNGGWMAAHPNPSNAQGVQQFLKAQGIETPVINIPGCPRTPNGCAPFSSRFFCSTSSPSSMRKTSPLRFSVRPSMTTASAAATLKTASSSISSVLPKKPRATASILWAAAVLRPRRTAASCVTTIVAAGASKQALPASVAARRTPRTPARTGSRSTLRSSNVIATCALATSWSSPALSPWA